MKSHFALVFIDRRTFSTLRSRKTSSDRSSKEIFYFFEKNVRWNYFQDEEYEIAQTKKQKIDLYRSEIYKQLQTLNLLDLVLVGRFVNWVFGQRKPFLAFILTIRTIFFLQIQFSIEKRKFFLFFFFVIVGRRWRNWIPQTFTGKWKSPSTNCQSEIWGSFSSSLEKLISPLSLTPSGIDALTDRSNFIAIESFNSIFRHVLRSTVSLKALLIVEPAFVFSFTQKNDAQCWLHSKIILNLFNYLKTVWIL